MMPGPSRRLQLRRDDYLSDRGVAGSAWRVDECLSENYDGNRAVFLLSEEGYGAAPAKSVLKVVGMYAYREGDRIDEGRRGRSYNRAVTEAMLMERLRGRRHVVQMESYAIVEWHLDGWFGKDLLLQMEYLPRTLDHAIRDLRDAASLSGESMALDAGIDICSALVECSEAFNGVDSAERLLHRDVKPSNIFCVELGDGKTVYKLGDFGIARILAPGEEAATAVLTESYAAPERLSGNTYDERADIFSVGLVLFALCNGGCLPKRGSDGGCVFGEASGGSDELQRIIQRACRFDPDARFRSAGEMKEALEAVRSSKSNSAAFPVNQYAEWEDRTKKREQKTTRQMPQSSSSREGAVMAFTEKDFHEFWMRHKHENGHIGQEEASRGQEDDSVAHWGAIAIIAVAVAIICALSQALPLP